LEQKQGLYHFQFSSNQIDVSDQPQNGVINPCIVLIGQDLDNRHLQLIFFLSRKNLRLWIGKR
ncbi:hypothetical protein U5A85_21280, partial [Priestia megaterium]